MLNQQKMYNGYIVDTCNLMDSGNNLVVQYEVVLLNVM
jgi:hypothetical protein